MILLLVQLLFAEPETLKSANSPEVIPKRIYTGRQLFVGLGAYANRFSRGSSTRSGETSLMGPLFPTAQLLGRFPITKQLFFEPAIGLSVIERAVADDAAGARVFHLFSPVALSTGMLDFKTGPALLLYSVSGSGGTKSVRNGSGTTTNYKPDGSGTSRLFAWGLGLGVRGLGPLRFCRLDWDIFGTGLFSDRRDFGTSLTVSYGLI